MKQLKIVVRLFCSRETELTLVGILDQPWFTQGPKRASHLHFRLFLCWFVYCDSYYGRLGVRAALGTNQMGYIIVIARLPGIYGNVNRPCPRASPSDSGRFTAISPWPRAITITYTMQLMQCHNIKVFNFVLYMITSRANYCRQSVTVLIMITGADAELLSGEGTVQICANCTCVTLDHAHFRHLSIANNHTKAEKDGTSITNSCYIS